MGLKDIAMEYNEAANALADINITVKALASEKDRLKYALINELNTVGLEQIKTNNITFTAKTATQPQAKDWDEIHKWIKANDYMHLLQRRISSVEFRNILEMGDEVPGVEAVDVTTILMKDNNKG